MGGSSGRMNAADPSSREVQLAVRRLKALERDWPKGWSLNSMAGTLILLPSEASAQAADASGFGYADSSEAIIDAQEQIVWSSTRIPNTGGDW